ncbi:hypothetical protein [Microbulbifer pacificus]|uniref:hypothetical protein n=1 Tax=Microbulbifer pacificus TaxID=407164 RepID=UPI000CF54338|nr:hypothetical protein [Microbulbifer pacificus]
MARQRRCAVALMHQQKVQGIAQARKIPLPLALGVAFVGGFLLQNFFATPAPRTLLNWYLTYQAFISGTR